ncbi:MAG: DNA alkylation repair protein [Proteobacteria bacterium]|nr:DNA alkylation repair protein [Pseudomonadota bacterium]
MANLADILASLHKLESPKDRAGMARFGINVENALGISVNTLRRIAGTIGHDHDLALALWESGIHEARVLASIVAEPTRFKGQHARRWVRDFNSWDLCDQCCQNLFWQIDGARDLALTWVTSPGEFTKRAGYTILAVLAFKDTLSDTDVTAFLAVVEGGAGDERNFVKKAVNWALRQIGKRNQYLNRQAIACAERLLTRGEKSARWIARDALRELTSDKIQERLRARAD